jgi:hypothetical protein
MHRSKFERERPQKRPPVCSCCVDPSTAPSTVPSAAPLTLPYSAPSVVPSTTLPSAATSFNGTVNCPVGCSIHYPPSVIPSTTPSVSPSVIPSNARTVFCTFVLIDTYFIRMVLSESCCSYISEVVKYSLRSVQYLRSKFRVH